MTAAFNRAGGGQQALRYAGRLPRRKKEILLSTIDSFLRSATASR
jgi:hypothetical protein